MGEGIFENWAVEICRETKPETKTIREVLTLAKVSPLEEISEMFRGKKTASGIIYLSPEEIEQKKKKILFKIGFLKEIGIVTNNGKRIAIIAILTNFGKAALSTATKSEVQQLGTEGLIKLLLQKFETINN